MTGPLAPLFAQARDSFEKLRSAGRTSDILKVWCDDGIDDLSSIERHVQDMESRLKYADAVARVWIVGMMETEQLRICAHPLAMVRGALDGETNPAKLGCVAAELEAALATSDCDELRAALSAREKEEE